MDPTNETPAADVAATAGSGASPPTRSRRLFAAGLIATMLTLGGVASVFAASPSASSSPAASSGSGSSGESSGTATPTHVCDRASDDSNGSSSS